MTQNAERETPNPRRSHRIYILWGVALFLLISTAVFCRIVVPPVVRARRAVERCTVGLYADHGVLRDFTWLATCEREIERLGGRERAAAALSLYLRAPKKYAPDRKTAVLMLGRCGRAGIPALSRASSDRDRDVKLRALEMLAFYIKKPETIEALTAAMDDPGVRERQIAVGGLARLKEDPAALDGLLKGLFDSDSVVVGDAARAVSELPCERVRLALIEALETLDDRCRDSVCEALGRLKERRAVEPLIKALQSGGMYVRRRATRALGEIGDPRAVPAIAAALAADPGEVDKYDYRYLAIEALGNLGKPAVAPLMKALKSEKNPYLVDAAVYALGKIGDPRALDLLIGMLRSERRKPMDLRCSAAEALGNIGDPRALPHLKALYEDFPPEATRDAAVLAAAKLKGGEGYAAVLALVKHEEYEVRKSAARALAKTKDSRAIPHLTWVVKNPVGNEGIVAARALMTIGGKGLDAVIACLAEGRHPACSTAAEALGASKDIRAVDALIAALRPESRVAGYAAESLGKTGDLRAVEPLIACLSRTNWSIRANAAEALGRLGDRRAVEPLVLLLKDGDKDVRLKAARALGTLGGKRAVEVLAAMLKSDASERMRWYAIHALGKLKDERAVDALLAILPESPLEAIRILGEIGNARATEALLDCLQDHRLAVRGRAAEALGKIGSLEAVKPLQKLNADEANKKIGRDIYLALEAIRKRHYGD